MVQSKVEKDAILGVKISLAIEERKPV